MPCKYHEAIMDIESNGLSWIHNEITWIGVGLVKPGERTPSKHYLFDLREMKELDKCLKCVHKLRKNKIRVIWQNGKFDTLFILNHCSVRIPIHDDIMLLGTAYDMAGSHRLEDMAVKYLGVKPWKIPTKLLIEGAAEVVKPYLTNDLDYSYQVYDYLRRRLTDEQWLHYKHILKPAYLMYRRTEERGIYIDLKKYRKVRAEYKIKRQERLNIIKKQYDINWGSPQQIQEVLFKYEKLPVIKKTPAGKPSADGEVLKRLAYQGYKLPQQILDYRQYDTLVKMFLNRWEEDASLDGRIHPSFGLTNVRTGRTSCSDPNLQQVPRDKNVRSCFTAPPGRAFFEADYSQLELRIAADYANDPTMIKIYKHGGDIHTSTAKIFTHGKEPSKEDRTKAKPVNFGYLYGMQAKGFVNYAFDNYDTVFTIEEARQNRQAYFALYSRLLEWHKEMISKCNAYGGVYNRFGRFRALPDIYSHDWGKRSGAERRAINTPVQSTGSDLLISSAAQIDTELRKEGVLICGTIHDAVVGECDEKDKSWVEQEIRRIMTHPKIMDIFDVSFKVPLEVDFGWGAWGSK